MRKQAEVPMATQDSPSLYERLGGSRGSEGDRSHPEGCENEGARPANVCALRDFDPAYDRCGS